MLQLKQIELLSAKPVAHDVQIVLFVQVRQLVMASEQLRHVLLTDK
jgi:hypothetical protein